MHIIKLYAYCRSNLGDDLMVDILLRRYPQYRFFCEDTEPDSRFGRYRNFLDTSMLHHRLRYVNKMANLLTLNLRRDFVLYKALELINRKCSCAISIGGSLYPQCEGKIEDQIIWEEQKIQPLFVIGANFGPYWDEKFRDAFEGYFGKCAGVTFRDLYSYELFKDGLENVSYAPDVVLNLAERENTLQGDRVVISVLDTETRVSLRKYTLEYERFIINVCESCVNQGKIPVLMSFCKHEGDEIAIERIIEQLSPQLKEKTETYYYSDNIEEALELLRNADSIFATRFHAMILAICFNKPVFCLAYNDKITHYLKDVHCDSYCNFAKLAEIPFEQIPNLCRIIDVDERYIACANKQFAQFERYMRQERRHGGCGKHNYSSLQS